MAFVPLSIMSEFSTTTRDQKRYGTSLQHHLHGIQISYIPWSMPSRCPSSSSALRRNVPPILNTRPTFPTAPHAVEPMQEYHLVVKAWPHSERFFLLDSGRASRLQMEVLGDAQSTAPHTAGRATSLVVRTVRCGFRQDSSFPNKPRFDSWVAQAFWLFFPCLFFN